MGVPKDKRLKLNRLKGWVSYVRGYNKMCEEWDKVDWTGRGTLQPKKVESTGLGRTRITF